MWRPPFSVLGPLRGPRFSVIGPLLGPRFSVLGPLLGPRFPALGLDAGTAKALFLALGLDPVVMDSISRSSCKCRVRDEECVLALVKDRLALVKTSLDLVLPPLELVWCPDLAFPPLGLVKHPMGFVWTRLVVVGLAAPLLDLQSRKGLLETRLGLGGTAPLR